MRYPAWRAKVGDAPALLGALGRKHIELKQFDEAEKYLKRYMELSPDLWVYESLASCYEARGDRDRWKATLDDFLAKTEDSGLQHAKVRVQLAKYLMKQKRWADAKKYAEPAAETWAAWAMTCASQCNEGLKDWERAELWIRRTAERYPGSSWAAWYLFCKRTGHGDVEAARAFAEAYLAAVEDRPDLAGAEAGRLLLLVGREDQEGARVPGEGVCGSRLAAVEGIALILLADELGDKLRRGKMLDEFCNRFAAKWPRVVAIARLSRDANGDAKRPLDLAAVERLLDRLPASSRGNTEFLVGKYLFNRGQRESSRTHLQQAADARETQAWLRLIATDSLRGLDARKGR